MQNRDFVTKLTEATNKPKNGYLVRNIQNVVMSDTFTNQLKLVQQLRQGMDLIKIVTPVNYAAERAESLGDPTDHPVFEYDQKLLDEISSVFADEGKFLWQDHNNVPGSTLKHLLVSLLENRTRDVCATGEFVDAMEQKNSHWQNQIMLEKYGSVDFDLSLEAATLLDELACPEEFEQPPKEPRNPNIEAGLALMNFGAEAAKEQFEFALGEYGFDIPVIISDEYKFVTVNYKPEIALYIPSDLQIDGIRLLELVRHEIECHVRDFMNSEYLFRPYGIKRGLGSIDGSELLTEGHAALEEDKLHQSYFGHGKKPDPWYVLAIDDAKSGKSFCEVAYALRQHFADCNLLGDYGELAWKYTYRVFRGSSNTFRPGQDVEPFVFTKDKLYLEGYLLAKELDAAGLGHWLEIGGFRPSELLEIASVADFDPLDVPYKDKDVTFKIYRSLLNTLELERLV